MSHEQIPRSIPNEEEALCRAIGITQRYLGELESAGMVKHPDISASYEEAQAWVAKWQKKLAAIRGNV
jgi:hypothetical protein